MNIPKRSRTKVLKIFLYISLSIVGLIALAFILFINYDFVGYKDPKITEENRKRWDNTLLSAEYRNGTDYCDITILDSTNIEINIGNKANGAFFSKKYKISKDTIILSKEKSKVVSNFELQYLNTNRFLISTNKIYYKLDKTGQFDTINSLRITTNKLFK